jgi:hypothetical protein
MNCDRCVAQRDLAVAFVDAGALQNVGTVR